MDRVVAFIERAAERDSPFLAVIWFHTPHLPILTGKGFRLLYSRETPDIQHYYGAISAMDRQIGRLRDLLTKYDLERNTVWFFTSDNGPEGAARQARTQGSTGGLRGRKRSLHEGGVRVPGFLYWPTGVSESLELDVPVSTSDYLPTVLDILGLDPADGVLPRDGASILPYITGLRQTRIHLWD